MSLPNSQKKEAASTIPQPKQIKFVSTDGLPQTKRRRVTAACRTCRKRKIKCSGERPVCQTCTDCGHACLGYNDDSPNAHPTSNPPTEPQTNSGESPEYKIKESRSPETAHLGTSFTPADGRGTLPKPQYVPPSGGGHSRAARTSASVGIESPESSRSALISSNRTHVPYFRYFGPTAIVPGFKQMVVRVRENRAGNQSTSTDSSSSVRSPNLPTRGSVLRTITEGQSSHSIQFYDPGDGLPNSELVTHLCGVFFTHIGSCFPFLQRDRFLRELGEKQLEPILVDAVCAVAARYSQNPLLKTDPGKKTKFPHHGDPFAHRAMCAAVDALACPTLAVVQACLLLAWEQFGSNHDSGLWMYLGISIRMAQDLGLQKLEGMKYRYGRVGLTPKNVRPGQASDFDESQLPESPESLVDVPKDGVDDERVRERARVDTFWSIFFLDRVISSGTGRPVTLRDDDIEIFFPLQSESSQPNEWPAPLPPLIRIIHLYGRITDMLNSIKEVNHVTPEKLRFLAGMESDLTSIYQRLSPKLHFNAVNFQNYVKADEGPNFLLLHFWFHTLIVLLHQPTLLHSFGGRIHQLFPNSRELSMSSAKTIADILAFAELIDSKSFIGTPFSSQPIYIAACAFLMESAYYSQPSSRSDSPPVQSSSEDQTANIVMPSLEPNTSQRKSSAKHSLLAAAAKENYQRCYKALKSLETYWEGIKYILTVLDQKAEGIWDPQLYTAEEMDSTIEEPPDIGSTLGPPGWKISQPQENSTEPLQKSEQQENLESSGQPPVNGSGEGDNPIDPTQAIGWSLTGDTNSSQPNLSFLYQLPTTQPDPATYPSRAPKIESHHSDSYQPLPTNTHATPAAMSAYTHSPAQYQSPNTFSLPAQAGQGPLQTVPGYTRLGPGDGSPTSNYNLGSAPNISSHTQHGASPQDSIPYMNRNPSPSYRYNPHPSITSHGMPNDNRFANNPAVYTNPQPNVDGMTIQSHDIDMNALQYQNNFPLSFDGEFFPWLEYLPQDVLNYFGENQGYRPVMRPGDPGAEEPSTMSRG